jgi:hypothetical protein
MYIFSIRDLIYIDKFSTDLKTNSLDTWPYFFHHLTGVAQHGLKKSVSGVHISQAKYYPDQIKIYICM